MPGKAAKVKVSERQWAVLQELSRSRTVAKGIVQRALILVRGVQGLRNEQIAVEVGLIRRQVGLWRRRWRDACRFRLESAQLFRSGGNHLTGCGANRLAGSEGG